MSPSSKPLRVRGLDPTTKSSGLEARRVKDSRMCYYLGDRFACVLDTYTHVGIMAGADGKERNAADVVQMSQTYIRLEECRCKLVCELCLVTPDHWASNVRPWDR